MRPSPCSWVSSRRAVGLALGLGGAAAALASAQQQSRLAAPPVASAAPARAEMRPASAGAATLPRPPVTPLRAVNLRDLGAVDPRLRKGVLFRCSQIYTPEVLRELRIRTVVDLRGRAERSSKARRGAPAAAPEAPVGPPPLLAPEQMDALAAAPNGSGDDGAAATAAAEGSSSGAPAGGDGPGRPPASHDVLVTRIRREPASAGSTAASSADEGDASEASEGEDERAPGGDGAGQRRRAPEDAAAALGETADWAGTPPETAAFNVIPGRQFGLAMLRMPPRVWRASVANLVTGRDPRRPFVEAFADEQLLGFFKYYKIILEHSKHNIAAVMRVFAKPRSLPSLVHCAHGKDRTGVIIMLLLLLCDVPHEAIVDDYVQSEIELRRYRESLGLPDPSGSTGAIIPLNDVIIASTAETLRALLNYLDTKYLTVDNYLSSCGLSQQELQAIRANLLTPEALAAVSGAQPGRGAAAAAPAGEGAAPGGPAPA